MRLGGILIGVSLIGLGVGFLYTDRGRELRSRTLNFVKGWINSLPENIKAYIPSALLEEETNVGVNRRTTRSHVRV